MGLKNNILYNKSHLKALWLVLIWVVLFHSNKAFSQKTNLPLPEAYYPLRTILRFPSIVYAKYVLVEVWDKSINGRHGTLVNDYQNSSTPGGFPTWNFEEGSFPAEKKTFPNVKKTNKAVDAHITIPNPYKYYHFSDNATVSFWYYWDGSGDEEILKTNDVIISVSPGAPTLTVGNQRGKNVSFSKVFNKGVGWYFIAAAMGKTNTTLYFNHYTGVISDLDLSKMETISKNKGLVSATKKNILGHCGLMTRNFDGQLRAVRFYKTLLSKQQVNKVSRLDYAEAISEVNENSSVLVGNYNYYPLGGDQTTKESTDYLTDVMHPESNGMLSGQVTANVKDRFNKPHAIKLEGRGTHIRITKPPTEKYDLRKGGITVSFWVKTPEKRLYSPIEGIDPPFTDKDIRYMQVYGYNTSKNLYSFGVNRVNDRIGVIRTAIDGMDKIFPWTFWYYDPTSYRDRPEEWVHIVSVQNPNWQRIYVENGDNDFSCECKGSDYKCWEKCQSRYNYQGIQTLAKEASDWGIGNRIDGEQKEITYGNEQFIDDVRIYRWPLSRVEVTLLHKYERIDVNKNQISDNDNIDNIDTSKDTSKDNDIIKPIVISVSVSAVLASTLAAYKLGVFNKIRLKMRLPSSRSLRIRATRFLNRSRYSRVSSEETEMQEIRSSNLTSSRSDLDSAQEFRMRGRACD